MPCPVVVNFCLAYKVIPSLLHFVTHTYCWIAQIHCCVTPVDLEIPGSLRSFLPAKHLSSQFQVLCIFFLKFFLHHRLLSLIHVVNPIRPYMTIYQPYVSWGWLGLGFHFFLEITYQWMIDHIQRNHEVCMPRTLKNSVWLTRICTVIRKYVTGAAQCAPPSV